MVEKLKSVLKTPRLKSGAKALLLALSLYLMPLWVSGILAFFFYFWPSAFSFSFLGSFISFFIVASNFSSDGNYILSALVFGGAFFLLIGVKNVLFLHRSPLFLTYLGFIAFLGIWEFFTGTLSLPVLALVIFLVVRDGLKSFTPLPGRTALLSAVSALAVAEISWAIYCLNILDIWASVSVALIFGGILFMIIEYLRGSLFKSNAHFWAVALSVIAFTITLIASF